MDSAVWGHQVCLVTDGGRGLVRETGRMAAWREEGRERESKRDKVREGGRRGEERKD